MIDFFISVIAVYIIFRILDWIFSGARPIKIREGDFVQKVGDQYYLVRDEIEKLETYLDETEAAPHQRRPNLKVVK